MEQSKLHSLLISVPSSTRPQEQYRISSFPTLPHTIGFKNGIIDPSVL